MSPRRKVVNPEPDVVEEGIVWTRVKVQPLGGNKYVLTPLYTVDGGPEQEAESTGAEDVNRDSVEKIARNILEATREREKVKNDVWYVE